MNYPLLTIEPKIVKGKETELFFEDLGKEPEPHAGTERKSRKFSAYLISYVCADTAWAGGVRSGNSIRPIWLRLAGSEQELVAFVANLQSGFRATVENQENTEPVVRSRASAAPTRIELLKSVGYRYIWQRTELDGRKVAVVTAYLPELLRIDPGLVDPVLAQFVILPPQWWIEREIENLLPKKTRLEQVFSHAYAMGLLNELKPKRSIISSDDAGSTLVAEYWKNLQFTKAELVQWLPVAAYFAAYLDRRTTRPLPDSLEFYSQLLFCSLQKGFAILPKPSISDQEYKAEQDEWAWAKPSDNFYGFGLDTQTVVPVLFSSSQQSLDSFLASQVRLYFSLKQGLTLGEILLSNEAEAHTLVVAKDGSSNNNNKYQKAS